jgi:hypothetical protein
MYTFIASAILGVIVSLCLYGKEFSQKLYMVALTVICITFGGTMIVSSFSTTWLPTEEVFTEKHNLIPYGDYHKVRDTTIKFTAVVEKGGKVDKDKMKADTVINYDTIPYFFSLTENGDILFKTDEDGEVEQLSPKSIEVKTTNKKSWYGIKKTRYKAEESEWVSEYSLPKKDKKQYLYLNTRQYRELKYRLNKFEDNKKKESDKKLIAENNGKKGN